MILFSSLSPKSAWNCDFTDVVSHLWKFLLSGFYLSQTAYGSTFWFQPKQGDIEKIQKRATKLVINLKKIPYKDRLMHLKLSTLKMICNDFLVVKVNCWSYVFNIMKYMWILRNVKNNNIVEKTYESVHRWFVSDDVIPGKHNQTMNQTAYWVLNVDNRSRNNT